MAIEIERKFLVASDGWRPLVASSHTLRQGYLSTGGSGVTVRVRTVDDRQGFITIKSGGSALARAEFEYEVPIADARQLLGLSRGAQIDKTRHRLDLPGGEWVVDEFGGRHRGLVIAEVELESPTGQLALPDWLGNEVTGNPQYYNSSLAMLVGGDI
ncbi:MAG: CYTH domain-containing protein [Devosia sp.]|uniref:CYTH domain-containing protein n=1 Tax=Devosia sp. TaxID=1871048 RepID=UPI001AC73B30|nr:CYTH domain-containing protein [Devosia sp.]MBN9310638.1 CYTH domain-containing protein [Devosia sp.]MBN9316101.1 CYTH domain-containing protein [Devosia sp.]